MNVLEIKGEMHELITMIKDERTAEKLLAIIRDFISSDKTEADEIEASMTPEEETAIRRAITRSYERQHFISSTEAENRLSKWLKP